MFKVGGGTLLGVAILAPVVAVLQGDDPRQAPTVALLTFAVVAVVATLSLWTSFRRQRRWLMTYELTITDDEVSRAQEHVAAMRIARAEITKIVEGDGGLAVLTGSVERCIPIPRALDGYAQARAALAEWRPIEAAQQVRWAPVILAGVAIVIAEIASAREPWPWAGVAAIALWAILGYLTWIIRRSPDVRRDHKNIWMVFFVWLASTPIARVLLMHLNELMDKLAHWH
ncbi:MAG TPA: hypothetical protein VGH87_21040 [Polyangiaceae bacterium]